MLVFYIPLLISHFYFPLILILLRPLKVKKKSYFINLKADSRTSMEILHCTLVQLIYGYIPVCYMRLSKMN